MLLTRFGGSLVKNEVFFQRGGLRVSPTSYNSFNATWPFASLTIDSSELGLACLGKKWSIPRGAIRKLSKVNGWMSKGLRMEHGIESYPDCLVFWTLNFDQLKEELERRGYSLD